MNPQLQSTDVRQAGLWQVQTTTVTFNFETATPDTH